MDESVTMTMRHGWHRYASLALHVGCLFLLIGFDLRDLDFKCAWVGPHDSFKFAATQTILLDIQPSRKLMPAFANVSEMLVGDEFDQLARPGSGGSSFLAKCKSLYASNALHTILATDCSIGGPLDYYVAEQLVLQTNQRVDAVAWGACKLLHSNRRPSVCQELMVTGFLQRYTIEDVSVSVSDMAVVNSEAEGELIRLLNLISRSSPASQIVCVSGTQVTTSSSANGNVNVVGCGSPSRFESEFAGYHATAFYSLLQTKQWLTLDRLNLMGLSLNIRHNMKTTLTLHSLPSTNSLYFTQTQQINLSGSGVLFHAMILFDLYLMLAFVATSIEIIRTVLWPTTDDVIKQQHYLSLWPRMLLRSPVIMWLTLASHLIAWPFSLPLHQVLYASTMSETSSDGKLHLLCSMVRLWAVVTIICHVLWDFVWWIHEQTAFRVVQRTFITTYEIILITAIVAVCHGSVVASVREEKYGREQQRLVDTTTFTFSFQDPQAQAQAQAQMSLGLMANVYNEDQDFLLTTPPHLLWLLYWPLVAIVGWSLLVIVFILIAKVWLLQRFGPSRTTTTWEASYERLPLENVLRMPVRAKSLVRTSFDVSTVSPSLYLDVGVLLDHTNSTICPRSGFFNLLPPKVDVSAHFAPDVLEKKEVGSLLPPVSVSAHQVAATTAAIAATDGISTVQDQDQDEDEAKAKDRKRSKSMMSMQRKSFAFHVPLR